MTDFTKFIDSLISATKGDKIKWNVVPSIYLSKLSEVINDLADIYYVDYKEGKTILIYQRKSFNEQNQLENVNVDVCIADSGFNIKYNLTSEDIGYRDADLFRLFKLVERKVNNIDSLIEDFVKDFNEMDF